MNLSRMRWAGHLVRVDAGKLAKGAEVEKGKATAEMGGLCEEGYEKIGEGKRWREGAADKKVWKERTERVARQYFSLTLTAGNKEEEHTSAVCWSGRMYMQYVIKYTIQYTIGKTSKILQSLWYVKNKVLEQFQVIINWMDTVGLCGHQGWTMDMQLVIM